MTLSYGGIHGGASYHNTKRLRCWADSNKAFFVII